MTARLHGNHAKMALQPLQYSLVLTGLNAQRPEVVIIIMATKTGNTDADCVLCTADDTVFTLRMILETEHEPRQCLRVHIRKLIGPDAFNNIARRGGKAASLTDFERRFQRNRNGPSGCVAADIRLIDPSARDIKSRRQLTRTLLQFCAAPRCKSLVWITLKNHIFHTALLTDPTFLLASAITVNNQNIRLHDVQRRQEIHHAMPLIDEGILYIADAFHHEQTLLLRINRLVILVMKDGFIRTNTHVQVAILSRLTKELHMTTMQ